MDERLLTIFYISRSHAYVVFYEISVILHNDFHEPLKRQIRIKRR